MREHNFQGMRLSKTAESLAKPAAKKELYAYLERAAYVRQWSPGKTFIGFNVTKDSKTGMFFI